jgi:hypothetical protein
MVVANFWALWLTGRHCCCGATPGRLDWAQFGVQELGSAALEVLRHDYDFVRPHRALKFGKEMRTPGVQAGLAQRPLTLRDVFCSRIRSACALVYCVVFDDRDRVLAWAA